MNRQYFHSLAIFALAFAAPLQLPAFAAQTISFADQLTSNLIYGEIEETNSSNIIDESFYAGVGTSGESLTFEANGFRVENFGGMQALDARMSLTVEAKPGHDTTAVRITEGGSASVFNAGSIARDTLIGFTTINGVQSAPGQVIYSLNGIANDLTDAAWQHSIEFSFSPVQIMIEVHTIPTVIPEPRSSLAILACGLTHAGFGRRGRSENLMAGLTTNVESSAQMKLRYFRRLASGHAPD